MSPRTRHKPTRTPISSTLPRAGLTAVLHGGGERKDHLLESVGTGAAFIDFDEDGRLDVFLVNAWALDSDSAKPPRSTRSRFSGWVEKKPHEGRTSRSDPDHQGTGSGNVAAEFVSTYPGASARAVQFESAGDTANPEKPSRRRDRLQRLVWQHPPQSSTWL